jgi:serine acetyltransferase
LPNEPIDDPSLIEIATLDLWAPFDRDRAGYIALQAYRISHRLWESGRTEFARELHGRITQARCMSAFIRP